MRRGATVLAGTIGVIENVSRVFHLDGRLEAPNSPKPFIVAPSRSEMSCERAGVDYAKSSTPRQFREANRPLDSLSSHFILALCGAARCRAAVLGATDQA